VNDRIRMTERCVFSGLTAVERQHEGRKKERESATGLSGRERDARSNTRTTKRIVETGPYIRARAHRALFLTFDAARCRSREIPNRRRIDDSLSIRN